MTRWFTCASTAPVVRRAAASALFVGPLLVAINHGDAILAGDISRGRLVRMVLTMFVPYAVSTFSSVQAVLSAPSNGPVGTAATEVPHG